MHRKPRKASERCPPRPEITPLKEEYRGADHFANGARIRAWKNFAARINRQACSCFCGDSSCGERHSKGSKRGKRGGWRRIQSRRGESYFVSVRGLREDARFLRRFAWNATS